MTPTFTSSVLLALPFHALALVSLQHAATVQTLSGVLFVGLAFLLVSGVQAVVMHSKWLRNPRQVSLSTAEVLLC